MVASSRSPLLLHVDELQPHKTKKPVREDENTKAQGTKQRRDEKRTLQQHHKRHAQKLLRLAADDGAAGHGDAQSVCVRN
jgi:hypothetical protein